MVCTLRLICYDQIERHYMDGARGAHVRETEYVENFGCKP